MTSTRRVSPRTVARTGGLLYLVIIFFGIFGESFARGSLVAGGDPSATAEKIMASEFLWRFGVAGNLLHLSCAVALALVFYVLLRPVDRDLALLAAFFNLVSITIEAGIKLNLLAVLMPLSGADYLQVFEPAQLHALAYLSIRTHAQGFGIALIFFGWMCLVLGYLVRRSGYLPGILGTLMQIAGACYLLNSFAVVLSPSLASGLFPWIMLPPLLAEASLCLWLIIKGVDVARFESAAGALGA